MEQTAGRRDALTRALRLGVVTVVWMTAEAALAIGAGVMAHSVLLAAFGVDSVIELASGVVLLSRLSVEARGGPADRIDRLEARTAAVSAVLLGLLCAFIVITSAAGLIAGLRPESSILGLAVSAAALVGMPLLALAKTRVNRRLQSASLRADVAETVTCAYMAAVALAGVALSMLLGAWWVQYLAALLLLVWLVPETREALEAARER